MNNERRRMYCLLTLRKSITEVPRVSLQTLRWGSPQGPATPPVRRSSSSPPYTPIEPSRPYTPSTRRAEVRCVKCHRTKAMFPVPLLSHFAGRVQGKVMAGNATWERVRSRVLKVWVSGVWRGSPVVVDVVCRARAGLRDGMSTMGERL